MDLILRNQEENNSNSRTLLKHGNSFAVERKGWAGMISAVHSPLQASWVTLDKFLQGGFNQCRYMERL